MKKVILAVALLITAGFASATDVGVYGGQGRGTNGKSQDLVGVSVGQAFGKFGVQGTADRSTTNKVDVNRYIISGSYDVVKLGPVQTNVRVGAAYLDPQGAKTTNGGAALVGVGASYPVTKQVALVADYAYQKGNTITKAYNGNYFTAGAKYSF